jgi:hypothetical protein
MFDWFFAHFVEMDAKVLGQVNNVFHFFGESLEQYLKNYFGY